MNAFKRMLLLLAAAGGCCAATAQRPFPVEQVRDGGLRYTADAAGNRVLDFSYCGYRLGAEAIPDAAVVVRVSPVEGDNSAQLQQAIDYVSTLSPDAQGLRGAVLLEAGTYALDEALWIRRSGVVLRGASKHGTVLVKRGCDRGAAIYIEGAADRVCGTPTELTTDYLPVGTTCFEVASTEGLAAGMPVSIRQEAVARPRGKDAVMTPEIARALGPGNVTIAWERTVTAVEGRTIEIDAALPMALDRSKRAATVCPYTWAGRLAQCGVEHLTIVSDYDRDHPLDENHAWMGVWIDAAADCWVRQVDFRHFAGSVVALQRGASRITVEDCRSTEPVSEIAGSRRRTFFTLGQHTLFRRCYSEHGQYDFSAGIHAPGPNAFVQCDTHESKGFSGSTGSWACGLLFDVVNIDGNDLRFMNLYDTFNRCGWNTANSMAWQCTAAAIYCFSPAPDAPNYANGSWAHCYGNGVWANSDNFVHPRSLYAAQLAARIGAERAEALCRTLPRNTSASSSPTIEQAVELAREAWTPRLTLNDWIEQAPFAASVSTDGVPTLDEALHRHKRAVHDLPALRERRPMTFGLKNGRLVADGALLAGSRQSIRWWNGSYDESQLPTMGDHLTRFVPDREGAGLTDRIDTVVAHMKRRGALLLDHNYGLWYDLRRVDHLRVRRRDADVWAPFYEQPFARSGEGTAWDGMSKYDLTRPNTWYWSRLKGFADRAACEGLLLFHQNYFQHNIIEAGAHWVDAPWRTTNNINDTGFAEPVNFAGDKRVFEAEMFYDVTHPTRRALHRNYIRMCLDHFAENGNVVQLVSEEFTGPLHFVEFWLDCIAEWQRDTGRDALVALSATKDVQDAILRDPERSKVVDLIDIRYWHHRADGTTYEPQGGVSMAPRQYARKIKVGTIDFASVYRAVNEYRTQYPDKGVTYFAQTYPAHGWAILMAGGSCPSVRVDDAAFLEAVPELTETSVVGEGCYRLGGDRGAVYYLPAATTIDAELPAGNYALRYIEPRSGRVTLVQKRVKVAEGTPWRLLAERGGAYWFRRIE